MAPEEEVVRGGQADQVLDAPIFREAMAEIDRAIEAQMLRVGIGETAMHTRLILLKQVRKQLQDYLERVRQTGQIATFQIEQERQRREGLWPFGRS